MERSLSIFRKFKQATGHPHPDWPTASANYKAMLAAMNLSPSEIEARLQAALE
jgi:hypothetical protein